ncbi:AfsR/SARP family transcriptional regulator [Kitasatospora sp. NPDC001683]
MRFSLLGPIVVRQDGRVLPMGGPKGRALLAALLFEANRAVSFDALQRALWGEQPPATAVSALHNQALRLRRALHTDGVPRLQSARNGLLLRVDEGELDVRDFTDLLAAAREARARKDWPAAAGHAGAALALWRGRPLSDLPELHTLSAEVEQLSQSHLQALECRFEAELQLGRHTEIAPELGRWAAHHPLHEGLQLLLVTSLYRSGRRAEALAAYETVRAALAEELGVDPGPALRALHQQILTSDPDPLPRAAADTPADTPADTAAAAIPTVPVLVVPRAPAPAQLPADAAFFTGRQAELDRLLRLLEQAADGNGPSVVTVTGMGGVGKSALAVHAAHLLRGRFPDGQLHLDLRGFGTGIPRETHEVLATLLDDLSPAAPATGRQPLPSGTDDRSALLRSVLADRRVLIVLDNARDSAQILPLLPGTGSSAMIVTSRNTLTDLPAAHHLPLAPMDAEEQRALLSALCGHDRVEQDLDAALRVLAACAGLPLALRIAGAQLAARPAWPLATLADRVGDQERGRLSALTAGLLDLRATFGSSYLTLRDSDRHGDREAARAFRLLGLWPGQVLSPAGAAALLDRTPGQSEDLLERLVDAHLLESPAPLRYRLHDLLAEYAAERADQDEPATVRESARERLCLWYALALENARLALGEGYQLPPRLDETPPAPLPVFTDQAQAMAWCRQELRNIGEAIRQAGQGTRPDLAWRLPVWLLGYMRTCWWTGQWEDYLHQGLRVAERGRDRIGRAWLLRTLGACHRMARRYDLAIEELEEALALFDDPASKAATQANLSIAYGAGCRVDQALAHARAALELHRRTGGSERHTAILLNSLAHALRVAGRMEEAEAQYREALVLWRQYGNANSSAVTLAHLGDVLSRLGRADEAFARLQEAVDIFQGLGNAALAADTLITMARTHARFAEWPQTRIRALQAAVLADRHGLDSWLSEARGILDDVEQVRLGARGLAGAPSSAYPALCFGPGPGPAPATR